MDRNKEIIRTSVVGIAANVLLAAFKAVVGLLASSIAIVMDAVNNLSDALASVITIVGTKLSERHPDRKHPFGYGRIEYFSAIIISIIVLMAGVTSFAESVKKIFNPSTPTYSTLTLTVIITAVLVKLVLGRYVKNKGKKLQSDSLIASGADAIFDAFVTIATLLSAVVMLVWHVNLDGIFGTLISLVVVKAGVDMLSSPVSELLGKSISASFVRRIKEEVMSFDEVNGVFDVTLNYYGPQTIIGSLHINVLDTMSARQIHRLTRKITEQLMEKYGIIATVGIYAVNTQGELADIQQKVMKTVYEHEHVVEVHAFYFYEDTKVVTLDVVPDDEVHDDAAFMEHLTGHLKAVLPAYNYHLLIDHNYTE